MSGSDRALALIVAYEGTGLAGFQRQRRRPTVQALLEEAFERLLGQAVVIRGASRTDAGVHARWQLVRVDPRPALPLQACVLGVNRLLPSAVRVRAAAWVPGDFRPRRAARRKTYRYRFTTALVPDVLLRRIATPVRGPVDATAMAAAARLLEGTHDFRSFAANSGEPQVDCRCTLFRSEVHREGDDIVYTCQGDRFLYKMVRCLAGTLLEVGRGRRAPADLPDLLAARDRRAAGPTAAARGLVLERILLDPDLQPLASFPPTFDFLGASHDPPGRTGYMAELG